MQTFETELIRATASNPQQVAHYLFGDRLDVGMDWFPSVISKKFFSSLASLYYDSRNMSLASIIAGASKDFGSFTPDEFKEVMSIWKTATPSDGVDVSSIVSSMKTNRIISKSEDAIGEYRTAVARTPNKVVDHLDGMVGKLFTLANEGVDYDPSPTRALSEPTMAMVGSWGNRVLDEMFSSSGKNSIDGGFPEYGFVVASMPTGQGKCLAFSTYIFTEHGMVQIGEYRNVLSGFSPLSIKVDSGKSEALTTHFYNSGIRETRTIKTRYGFSIKGTLNHPVMTMSRKGEYIWKNMEDIETGDFVAISRTASVWGNNDMAESYTPNVGIGNILPNVPDVIGEDDAYIFGALVGNGGMTQDSAFVLSEIDEEVIQKFYKWCDKIGVHVGYDGRFGYRVSNTNLRRWLEINGIPKCKSIEKEVPFTILRGSERNIRAFLRGLFDTDGSSLKNGGIEWCSSSDKLAEQVHILLTRFGVIARKRTKKTYAHDAHILTIHSYSAEKFYSNVGFGVKRKQDRSMLLPDRRNSNTDVLPIHVEFPSHAKSTMQNDYWVYYSGKHNPSYAMLDRWIGMFPEMKDRYGYILDDWYFWDAVTEVYDSGYEECYDLTVDELHSFVSNGIVSHNSTLGITMAAHVLAYGLGSVVIMSNELPRSMYAHPIKKALTSMFAGEASEEQIDLLMDERMKIYAPTTSKTERGYPVTRFEQMNRFVNLWKPRLAIMDSINNITAPVEDKGKIGAELHEAKANALRNVCLSVGTVMYCPGNMSKDNQAILTGKNPGKLQNVMLFQSISYENASDWSFLGYRDQISPYIMNIRRTKNRHGKSLGENWNMKYVQDGGYYAAYF